MLPQGSPQGLRKKLKSETTLAKSIPQGLKPAALGALVGTDKSVPFQNIAAFGVFRDW
jgi:hypothetical protein